MQRKRFCRFGKQFFFKSPFTTCTLRIKIFSYVRPTPPSNRPWFESKRRQKKIEKKTFESWLGYTFHRQPSACVELEQGQLDPNTIGPHVPSISLSVLVSCDGTRGMHGVDEKPQNKKKREKSVTKCHAKDRERRSPNIFLRNHFLVLYSRYRVQVARKVKKKNNWRPLHLE